MILHTPRLRIKNLVDSAEIQADQSRWIFDSSLQQWLEHLWPQRRAAAKAEVPRTVSLQGKL